MFVTGKKVVFAIGAPEHYEQNCLEFILKTRISTSPTNRIHKLQKQHSGTNN